MSMKHLVGTIALIAVVIVGFKSGTFPGFGGSSNQSKKVAEVIGADWCLSSGYQEINRLDGSKSTIYDCMTGAKMRCVTYQNGIASDATVEVRALFAATLGSDKPTCIT